MASAELKKCFVCGSDAPDYECNECGAACHDTCGGPKKELDLHYGRRVVCPNCGAFQTLSGFVLSNY